MIKYIDGTAKAGKEFYLNFSEKNEAIVMLNLLKFKSIADYTDYEFIKPKGVITGEEAYQLYSDNIAEELRKIGSQILFYGESNSFLIGPEHEKWDAIILVKHLSIQGFLRFAESEIYQNNVGHRAAGLEDSRLLPTTELRNNRS